MATTTKLPDSDDPGGKCPRCGVFANFDISRIWYTRVDEGLDFDEAEYYRGNAGYFFCVEHTSSRNHGSIHNPGTDLPGRVVERLLFVRCQRCKQGSVVVESLEVSAGRWTVTNHWPHGEIVVPTHLPAKIEALFVEAASCMHAGAPRGAATMTRTTIDAAIQDCGATGPDTKQRIASMAGRLPQQLIDMAHELRLGGNDAAHEFKHNWSVEDAQELLDFLRQLLHHLYEVPRQLKAVQRKTARRRSTK